MDRAEDRAGDCAFLQAYARRLGHAGPWNASLAVLRALQRAQVARIPFENIDVLLGRTPALDAASLQAKLLDGGRGGYCFEQNGLLLRLLQLLGFEVRPLLARVLWRASTPRPRTHQVLLLRVDGQDWLVDVGFGLHGLLEPLCLQHGLVQAQGLWQLRACIGDAGWTVQSWIEGRWQDLYVVGPEPQLPVDFEMANHYTATHPSSRFTQALAVVRSEPQQRLRLLNLEFSRESATGTEQRQLAPAELGEVLATHFGLQLLPAEVQHLQQRLA